MTAEDLLEYFSGFGTVLNAYIIYDPRTKLTKSNPRSPRLRLRRVRRRAGGRVRPKAPESRDAGQED